MQIEEALARIQAAYPRIYHACHSRHQNARTTPDNLSQRYVTLLAHLNETFAVQQGELAEHVGVAKSTLSEALSGLEERGFLTRWRDHDDGRETLITRTAAGTEAMRNSSVLEPNSLMELLRRLTQEERNRAVEGLELLAGAVVHRATNGR